MKRLIILIFALVLLASAGLADAYPMTLMITDIDPETDTFWACDFTGHVWEFSEIEDWHIGDFMACIMDDQGTEVITDDVVTMAYYAGYMTEYWGWY